MSVKMKIRKNKLIKGLTLRNKVYGIKLLMQTIRIHEKCNGVM